MSTSLVTTNLNKFNKRALDESATLLRQFGNSNIEFDGDMQLKHNTDTHETFLSNGDIALVAGDSDHLLAIEMDDYSREFTVNSELRYGRDSDTCENAMAVRQELVEYESVADDYSTSQVQEAISTLDQIHQTALKPLIELSNNTTLDRESIPDKSAMNTLADTFATIRATAHVVTPDVHPLLQCALNELKVALEQ